MKKIFLLALLITTAIAAPAQLFKKADKSIEPLYAQGSIPVINGKVTFKEIIPAEGKTPAQIYDIAQAWIKERFVEPTVLSKKEFQSENPNSMVIKSEEYIVFKNKFLVLDRARIYYYLTLTTNEDSCTFNMSRITYWYDEEEDKGGLKNMKAEEWITDENAFNKKGEFKPFESKFRCKTIDLKNMLVDDLKKKLNAR